MLPNDILGGTSIVARMVAHKNAPQNLGTATWTLVTWPVEDYDDEAALASDIYTVPLDGDYDLSVHLQTETGRGFAAQVQRDIGAGFVAWERFGPSAGIGTDLHPYSAQLTLLSVPLIKGWRLKVLAWAELGFTNCLADSYWTVRRWA